MVKTSDFESENSGSSPGDADKVARVIDALKIAVSCDGYLSTAFHEIPKSDQIAIARAVIEAVRDPT